ncbi:MAG: hypothetical protein ACJAYN_003062 [Bermanella sp.]|jgi:hypothetical protein
MPYIYPDFQGWINTAGENKINLKKLDTSSLSKS